MRVYRTSAAQRFHTDSADVVGLMCLQRAERGGRSCIASSVAIYRRLADTRPELAAALEDELCWDRKGELRSDGAPYYRGAVFNRCDGKVVTIYDRKFLETCSRHGAPELTALQIEALDALDALAASDEFRVDMDLHPGDIQLLHNHSTLHARTAFSGGHRHLLRLWLSLPAVSRLPPPPPPLPIPASGRGLDSAGGIRQRTLR